MHKNSENHFETRLREVASAFPYPETPEISSPMMQPTRRNPFRRRLPRTSRGWAASAALVVLVIFTLTALFVPSVRAQVLEWLQIGAIRIFNTQPEAVPDIFSEYPDLPQQVFPSMEHLTGETTLGQAENEVQFPVRLPAYPPDLGPPDRVFLQDFGNPAVLLVWTNPARPEQILLDLLILSPGTFAQKTRPEIIAHTSVNGLPAIWTQGQHYLQVGGIYKNFPLVVEGNILIWEQDGITYRLESALSMEEAVKIAESLQR